MRVTTTVNGERREADDVWEGESLLYVLRERMGLPGSKNACEQGECGSCTVYLDGVPVCACLVAAGQAEGREVGTVEGLADGDDAAPGAAGVRRGRRGAVRLLHPGPAGRDPRPAARASRGPTTPRSARRWPATCAAAPATRRSSTPCAWPPSGWRGRDADEHAPSSTAAHVVTMDAGRTEHAGRARRRRGQPDHRGRRRARRPRPSTAPTGCVDGAGCLLTPGLVNTHHHLYQWVTRGLRRRRARCSSWLTTLYPVWAGIDEDAVRRRRHRRAWPGWPAPAARRRTDHHYVFPRDGGDLLGAEIEAARSGRACASTRPAARWTSGQSQGGLPPDHVVEDLDAILAATEAAIDRFHDPSPGSMLRVARRALLAVLGDRATC